MRTRNQRICTWLLVLLPVLVAGVGPTPGTVEATDRPIRVAYVKWSSSIASANLAKAVFQEKMGRSCRLLEMDARQMWAAVAEGEADAMLSAWLPDTHATYLARYGNRMVNLGPNLVGTKVGLVVPNITAGRLTAGTGIRNRPYMNMDSIPELAGHADKINHRIIGIDPEAGVMRLAEAALEAYDLGQLRLIDGSEVSMVAELSHAIRRQQWIVVTGWMPHWIFARWDLKFLKDPKNVFGSGGQINTMVRRGLAQEMPEVYAFLDRFHWKPEEIGQLMLWNQEDEGLFPYEKSLRYMRTHPDQIRSWLP